MAVRPTVYGSEARFKASLRRHIVRGRELLAEAQRVHDEMASTPDRVSLQSEIEEMEWTDDVERWRGTVLRSVRRALGRNSGALLAKVTVSWPSDSGKPRHARTIGWVEPWLRDSIRDLESLLGMLGVRRDLAISVPPPSSRFAELRASGLVDAAVIDAHAREMGDPRSPKQLVDAIGAAKELTEATLRGALDRVGEPWGAGDDLGALMRTWRRKVGRTAPPDSAGIDALDKVEAALGNVVVFLGEWRNLYGRGHGRTRYEPGLRQRHARIAVDCAEAVIRFVVTTMDDLALLAPETTGQ